MIPAGRLGERSLRLAGSPTRASAHVGLMETLTRPDTSRQLVTLETVTALSPIETADFIAVAKVRGWNLVVKKDEVKVGDKVLYFEIDSLLPLADPRSAFLEPRGAKPSRASMATCSRPPGCAPSTPRAWPCRRPCSPSWKTSPTVKILPPSLASSSTRSPFRRTPRHGRREVPDQLRSEDRAARVQNLEGVFAELCANYDWHLRYVGVDAATDIAARGITLEEYLAAAPQ